MSTDTTTYCITTCSEATGWKRVIVAEVQANNDMDALEAYYSEHHSGLDVILRRAFLVRSMTVGGTRYVAFTRQFLDDNPEV